MAQETDCTALWQVALVMEPSSSLKGKTFSITGHLGVPRDDVVRIIETAGGKFEPEPRFGVTYLITNKSWNKGSTVKAGTSNKLLKAERLGIKILSEMQFCQMVIDGDDSAKVNLVG
jgi:NAD-dependent DNA ligase